MDPESDGRTMTLHDGPAQPDCLDPVDGAAAVLGQIGTLRVRLARGEAELHAAQRLRHDIFTREFGADLGPACAASGRDFDDLDPVCDHLVVIDTALEGPDAQRMAGTYRLLPQSRLGADTSFYSASSYDLGPLISGDGEALELGRSCVLPAYRSKRTVELLWQGIWAYCRQRGITSMFGCASFAGTEPAQHAMALSFLHHHAREASVMALPGQRVSMDLMPAEAIDLKSAMKALPPLIKGYLRLGARFGDGAVIDRAFRSVDVLVILPVNAISSRYVAYYGEDASRFAG